MSAAELYDKGRTLFYKEKKIDEASECFDQAIKADPNYIWAYFEKANILHLKGENVDALEYLKDAQSLDRYSLPLCNLRAKIYKFLGKEEDAVYYLTQGDIQNRKPTVVNLFFRAEALKAHNKQEEAKEYYSEAKKLDPRYGTVNDLQPEADKGGLIIFRENFKDERIEAKRNQESAKIQINKDAVALYLKGRSLNREEKNYKEALTHLNEAIKLDWLYNPPYLEIIDVLRVQGRYYQALRVVEIIVYDADNRIYGARSFAEASIYYSMGDEKSAKENYEVAIRDFKADREEYPRAKEDYLNLNLKFKEEEEQKKREIAAAKEKIAAAKEEEKKRMREKIIEQLKDSILFGKTFYYGTAKPENIPQYLAIPLDVNPSSVPLYIEKANVLHLQGQNAEALQYIKDANFLEYNYAPSYYLKAKILAALQKKEEAKRAYKNVSNKNSAIELFAEADALVALLNYENEEEALLNYKKAEKCYAKAKKKNPTYGVLDDTPALPNKDGEIVDSDEEEWEKRNRKNSDDEDSDDDEEKKKAVDALLLEGRELLDGKKDLDKALKCFNQVISLRPKHLSAYVDKAETLRMQGLYARALRCLDKSEKFGARDYIPALYQEACIYFSGKNVNKLEYPLITATRHMDCTKEEDRKAETRWRSVFSGKTVEAPEIDVSTAQGLFSAGKIFYYTFNKLDDAIKTFDQAISMDPNFVEIYTAKANLLRLGQKLVNALECLETSIKIDQNYLPAYYLKARVLVGLKRKPEAQQCVDLAEDLLKNKTVQTAQDHFYRGMALFFLGQKDEALECLTQAILSDPDYVEAYCDKSIILSSMKKTSERLECLDKAIAINPWYARPYFMKSRLLLEMGNANEATELMHKASSMDNYVSLAEMYNFEDFSEKLDGYDKKLEKHEQALDYGGVYDKASITKSFQDLQNENPRLYEYNKAFYWTLLNYFSAYKALSSGVVQGKTDTTVSFNEQIVMGGVQVVTKIAGQVPLISGAVSLIDFLISEIYGAIKGKRFEDRVNAINKIIIMNKDPKAQLDEDVNFAIAKAAIEVTRGKKDEILNPKPVVLSKYRKVMNFINEKIDKLKTKALGESIELYESEDAALALKDVTLLLAYMYKNYEEIITKEEPLDVQIKKIVLERKTDTILESAEKSVNAKKQASPAKEKASEKAPSKKESATKGKEAKEASSTVEVLPQERSKCCSIF